MTVFVISVLVFVFVVIPLAEWVEHKLIMRELRSLNPRPPRPELED